MKNISTRFFPALGSRLPRGNTIRTVTKPNGLFYKNGLFVVDGTTCIYNGNVVSGLSVTDDEKTLVGMGAYIVIFPDKKVFNTATGEVKAIDATLTQSASMTFEELSTDSVYCKITFGSADLQELGAFYQYDSVKFEGVNDSSFQVDGQPAVKAITEKGNNYIIVTASIQNTYSGSVTISASGGSTRLAGTGIEKSFKVNDTIRTVGFKVNVTGAVTGVGTNYITVGTSYSGQTEGINNAVIKRTQFTRASGITISRYSPTMDFVCEHDNRLWGCSSLNHEIYCSKLGDPTNWNSYEGISTDSYTATVGSDGVFTGCISHLGYVLFFKENSIHIMYGSKPSNYQLNSKQAAGVREGCDRSLVVVNETLFYVGRNGVYAYDGASPVKASQTILSDMSEAVCSQQDNKYYVSCLKNGVRTLMVYDPLYQIWDVEDDTQFKYAVYGDGVLYYINSSNELRTITGNSDERIYWSVESGQITEAYLDEKYITKAKFNFLLDEGAEANIYFRYDEDPLWHRKGTIHSVKRTTYTLPIIAQRCNKFQWKMEGHGTFRLIAMGVTVEGGSELNGTIQSWLRR